MPSLLAMPDQDTVAEFFLDLTLAVGWYALVLAGVYYFILAAAEEKAVKDNTERVISNLLGGIKKTLSPEANTTVQNAMSQLTTPDMAAANEAVRLHNQPIVLDSVLVVAGMAGAATVLVVLVWWLLRRFSSVHISLKHLFIQNGLLLAFVVATQAMFVNAVPNQYRSVDTNEIRRRGLGTVLNFIKS